MNYDKVELELDGFVVNQNSIVLVQPLKLVKNMLKQSNMKLVMDDVSEEIYYYKYGVYQRISEQALKSFLMKYIDSKYPDLWKPSFEAQYYTSLINSLPRKKMNNSKQYLTLSNGILDLETRTLKKHTPKHYSTIKVEIEYDIEAVAPTFEKFLSDISCGDKEMILTLSEILGYCLTTSTKASKLFILYGSGSNGKSSYLNLIKKLVGKGNVQSIPLKDFDKAFTRHFLSDTLVNVISEGDLSNKTTLISDTVKNFVTGEDVSAEIKGGNVYSYTPVLKIILATNRLPSEINSITFGETRRILLLSFNQRFSGKNDNKNLAEMLDKELSGILNIALDGYERLKNNNFVFSYEQKSNLLLNNYLVKQNPLQIFIEEYVEEDSAGRIYYDKAFNQFCKYCERNGVQASYTQDIFSRQFRSMVVNKYSNVKLCHSNANRGIKGVSLKD